jgi:hypothetical protein
MFIIRQRFRTVVHILKIRSHLSGELAERPNAAVLKTVEEKSSGGSNPSLSAIFNP